MVGENAFGRKHLATLKNIDDVTVTRESGIPLRTLNLDNRLLQHGIEAAILTTHTDLFATGSSA